MSGPKIIGWLLAALSYLMALPILILVIPHCLFEFLAWCVERLIDPLIDLMWIIRRKGWRLIEQAKKQSEVNDE